jgi:hypothetical protein
LTFGVFWAMDGVDLAGARGFQIVSE